MFQKLLTKIHDPNISLDRIVGSLKATLGQSTVRSVIGAGLIHIQQLSEINAKDVISCFENVDCKFENKHSTCNTDRTNSNLINSNTCTQANIVSDLVLNNKDLCYRIVSHCNGQEINRHITIINKYFNSICNSPQTYQYLKYSKSIVGKGRVGWYSKDKENSINQKTWRDKSMDIILRYRHCNSISIDTESGGEFFYTKKNIQAFEKFTKIKHLYFGRIYQSSIGDKFFATLDNLFVTNKYSLKMAQNVELLDIGMQFDVQSRLDHNYTKKICGLISRATFSNVQKINVVFTDFAGIFKAITSKDIPNTYKDAAMADSNSCLSLFSYSFPKLKDIAIYARNRMRDDKTCLVWYAWNSQNVADCRDSSAHSHEICKACFTFGTRGIAWFVHTIVNIMINCGCK